MLAGLVFPALLAAAPAASAADLAVDNAVLAKRVKLARGDAFYLLLSPKQRTLTLLLHEATLFVYQVQELTMGEPRVAYFSRGAASHWQGEIWTGGTLDPPRKRG